MSSRRLVLVAGAGRSGTSTVAGLLRTLGVHVPQPEVVADESNPKGFGEPRWAVDFHDRLLDGALVQVSDSRPVAWEQTAAAGADPAVRAEAAAWLEQHFAVAPELVVKDPRLTWFTALWLAAAAEVGAEVVFVTMLRPVPEVVRSRQAYYNAAMADAFGVAQWVNLMLGTERATRGHRRALIRYADLVGDWKAALLPAGESLGLEAVRTATAEQLAEGDAFVDPSLRRMAPSWEGLSLPADLQRIAEELWQELDRMASGDDGAAAHARIDALAARYAELYAGAEAIARSSIFASRQLGRRNGEAQAREAAAAAGAAPVRRRRFSRR